MSNDLFTPRSQEDIERLILEYPLAWVVSPGADLRATLLPLQAVKDAGRMTGLIGHFARSNPQVQLLQREPRALILFLGTQAYISPSWMTDRTRAPTWNYVSAQFIVDIEFFEKPAEIEAHLRTLVGTMESGRSAAWTIEDMGARYRTLSRGVIGFIAHLRETRAKFKLGQDEPDGVFGDIMLGLERENSAELLEWMRAYNSMRGKPAK